MSALPFPCRIFETQKRMDDYSAEDMRYGDLTESQLKNDFHLHDVSTRIDPYTLTEITPLRQPHSRFYGSRGAGAKHSVAECAAILFDEMRHLSQAFAIYGPYKYLIEEMITHMQQGEGAPFSSEYLNSALRMHIMNDESSENSTRLRLQEVLSGYITLNKGYYPAEKAEELKKAVSKSKLPKFDRFQDNINGMGITVHDTWATHITIESIHVNASYYRAAVNYKIQDHFGLDAHDILNAKFNLFRFFRIWFVLQRYHRFGFKPFITHLNATIEINGEIKK
ncbi:YPO3983 family protein [Pantoea sp. FN0305]|uniref:YPO3983 family protein n=1 Tax=Pantoea sp. FN0305 TaxID=3418559 RepID=UPI003CEFFD3E